MIKMFVKVLILSLFIGSFFLVQAQSNMPLIYQTFIRDGFDRTDGGYISIIDPRTFNELGQIDLIPSSSDLTVLTSNNKLAFIANNPFVDPNKGMVIVDLGQKKVITRMFDGTGVYGLKLGPDGNIWVLLDETKEVAILNPNSLEVLQRLTLQESPRDIIFSLDGSRAYISLYTSNIFVIDARKKTTIRVITNLPQRNKFQLRPMELEISPDGGILYVASGNAVSFVNTNTFSIVDTLSVPINSDLILLKLTPDGKTLYIAGFMGISFFTYNTSSKELSNKLVIPQNKGVIANLNIPVTNNVLYIMRAYGLTLWDIQNQSFITTIQTSPGIGTPNPFSFGSAFSGDFSIGQAPALQTTAPVANQQVTANQTISIKWQTTVMPQSYSIASHKIELSTDGGMTFNVIPGAEQLKPEAQDFTWQVPDIETSKAQIRVSTVDLGARRASSTTGNFTISRNGGGGGDTQPPMVDFLSPKGGETFNSGDTLQISWSSSDNVGVTSQDLSLSTDGGATFPITLASGLSGSTQQFTYQIPMSLQSNQTRLKLVVRDAAGNMAQATTPSNFSIMLGADNIPPTVTISQPTQSQSIIAGQTIQVKWQSTDNRAVASQALLLSFDNGKTFNQIASFGATDSSFTLSNIDKLSLTTPQAIVKITALDSTGNKGEANAIFTISPAITNAVYQTQSKLLAITGIGFMSNVNNNIRLFVNDKEVSLTPKSVSNSSFTIKGNKKKLNITKGSNTVRLVVDGVMSNSFSFMF